MLRFDLQIPIEHTPKRRRRKGVAFARPRSGGALLGLVKDPFVLAALLLVVGVFFVTLAWGQRLEKQRLVIEERLKVAVADSVKYANTVRQAESLQDREKESQDRINRIARIDTNRFAFVHLMDEASSALLPDMWITGLGESARDTVTANVTARLEGYAPSDHAVSSFIGNLSASPFVASVALVKVEREIISTLDVVHFTIDVTTQLPDVSFLDRETIRPDGTVVSSRQEPSRALRPTPELHSADSPRPSSLPPSPAREPGAQTPSQTLPGHEK